MTSHAVGSLERKGMVRLESEIGEKHGAHGQGARGKDESSRATTSPAQGDERGETAGAQGGFPVESP